MKLDGFKELLLKKSEDNGHLQLLIKYMREDYLADHIIESLQKMAGSNAARNPNSSLLHMATNMNKFKSGMIYDALSHHASHYKAALKAGDKGMADKHMQQIFKTMHAMEKIQGPASIPKKIRELKDSTKGRLDISAVDPKPWERGAFQNTLNRKGEETGAFTTDTTGWKRHNAKNGFDWLRSAPHPDSRKPGDDVYRKEVGKHGHTGAYPIEEISVDGKHIDIDENIKHDNKFTSHPFDSHPIYNHYDQSPNAHTPEKKAEYLKSRDDFHNNPEGGKAQYRAKIGQISKEDFANRGVNKADPVHDKVEGLSANTEPKTTPVDLKSRLEAIRQMGKK